MGSYSSEYVGFPVLDDLFLELSKLGWTQHMLFCGGWTMGHRLPAEARLTHDIDCTVDSSWNWEKFKKDVLQLNETFLKPRGYSLVKFREPIPGRTSAGIFIANNAGDVALGMDISYGDTSYGTESLPVRGIKIETFTPERMLADKICAAYSRVRFRRAKDLYDIYIIVSHYKIHMQPLTDFLTRRNFWDSVDEKSPFRKDVMEQYSHAWDMLKLTAISPDVYLEKPAFSNMLNVLSNVVLPVIRHHINKQTDDAIFVFEKQLWLSKTELEESNKTFFF